MSAQNAASSPAYTYRPPASDPSGLPDAAARTVVGSLQQHTVQEGETLLDIARDYELGYLEIKRLYPDMDPWLPPPGKKITIPQKWILPKSQEADIVINLPELRLYYYLRDNQSSRIQTYPVGIGSKKHQSPVNGFVVGEKRQDPHWYLPKSLQEKYNGLQVMAPGPQNPLGKYWIGLGGSSYGLHGTNNAWSVGRLATNGCIRLYPEHIRQLFDKVRLDDRVMLIYEPIKLGFLDGRIYAEAHPDIYDKIDDYLYYGYRQLTAHPFAALVDLKKYRRVLKEKNGLPVDVSSGEERIQKKE